MYGDTCLCLCGEVALEALILVASFGHDSLEDIDMEANENLIVITATYRMEYHPTSLHINDYPMSLDI